MRTPHERRLPLVLAALAAGVSAAWVGCEVLGGPSLPGPWALGLTLAALVSAVVAGRVARALPAGDVPEDPFARLEVVPAVALVPPSPRRLWPVVRGLLATVGALTVLTAATLAGASLLGPTLRNLFGAPTTCLSGEPAPPPPSRHPGHLGLVRDRPLAPVAQPPHPLRTF